MLNFGRDYIGSAIKLSQNGGSDQNPDVQVLRVGNFNHPKYGEFEITPHILMEMKSNFDAKVRGIDIALDYFHESDKEASGWIKELYLKEGNAELWAKVDWTPNAQRKLSDREIRYFSPDFTFKWEDPETGSTFNNVLFGGGLTNRPFVKEMAAIVANEGDTMTLDELAKQVKKLSEDGADMAKKHSDLLAAHSALQVKHAALQKKMDEMSKGDGEVEEDPADGADGDPEKVKADEVPAVVETDTSGMKKQLAETRKQLSELRTERDTAKKEAEFSSMLTAGKVCAAQKDAYLKGDMAAFVKLAEPINLASHGHGNGGETSVLDEVGDDAILKLAEEKLKADRTMSRIDAMTEAAHEIARKGKR